MKFVSVFILCIGLLSCAKKKETPESGYPIKVLKPEADDSKSELELENYLVNEQTDTANVQVFNFDCVVFIYPTHKQIEEMKKTMGEDDFYTLADDNNFYQSQATQIIDSAGIKTTGTQKQFIKFVGRDQSWTLDIRKKNLPEWNLILFQKNKPPQPSSAVSLTYQSVKDFFE